MSSAYYLTISIILVTIGAILLALLVTMSIISLNILKLAMQTRRQLQPVMEHVKQLTAIGKAMSGKLKETGSEIKQETTGVSRDLSRRARQLGWLFRHTVAGSALRTTGAMAGIVSGVRSWQHARRHHQEQVARRRLQRASERAVRREQAPPITPATERRRAA